MSKYILVQVNPNLIHHHSPDQLANVFKLHNTIVVKLINYYKSEPSGASENSRKLQRIVLNNIVDREKKKHMEKD